MREIKFRGKSIVNDEWMYGDLIIDNAENYFIHIREEKRQEASMVYSDTVGQFTGLHDKNGKEIYFGDIVRNKYGDIGSVIWFSDWSIRIDWGGGDIHFIDPEWGLEVIGNIHDNPELLKTE